MNFIDQPLAEIAIELPMSTEIFRRHQLDFCCGGKQTLKDACAKKNIEPESIINELSLLSGDSKIREERPLKELTAFIVERYHDDLRRRFPELHNLALKVERVHADHEQCPKGLSQFLNLMMQDMFLHMMKEENVLFPLINSGRGNIAFMPIKVMSQEHESHGKHLEELRALVSDYVPPQDACTTWRALYKGLEKLEEELMDHIHLENNIVFPRALAGNE